MPERIYVRKFDWDEAVRLRESGMTIAGTARRLEVSESAIAYATNPRRRAHARTYGAYYQRLGKCSDCGGECSYNPSQPVLRCRACRFKYDRFVFDGKAYCPVCARWKKLDDFTADRKRKYRGVRSMCRSCETAKRRELRRRNREAVAS